MRCLHNAQKYSIPLHPSDPGGFFSAKAGITHGGFFVCLFLTRITYFSDKNQPLLRSHFTIAG